jgi:hypothetical protein
LLSQLTEQKRLNNILKLAINRLTADIKEKDDLIKEHSISQAAKPTSAFLTQGAAVDESKELVDPLSVLKSDYSDVASQRNSLNFGS